MLISLFLLFQFSLMQLVVSNMRKADRTANMAFLYTNLCVALTATMFVCRVFAIPLPGLEGYVSAICLWWWHFIKHFVRFVKISKRRMHEDLMRQAKMH